jgi:Fe2+ transport system protein FeoA
MATLSDAQDGTEVTIDKINGGQSIQSHLAGMGIVSGIKVTIMSNKGKGPISIRIKNFRMALGRKMAKKVSIKKP